MKKEASASPQDTQKKQQEKENILSKVPEEIFRKGGDEAVAKPAEKKGLGLRSEHLQASDFEALRILGTGTFARVWLTKLRDPPKGENNKVYALKVLRKDQVVKLKQVDHVKHEREILGDVAGHPFITTLITTFSDRDCLYMLLDYCPGGEIFSYLRKQKRFPEQWARFYVCEIVLVFEFLHEKEGVAYRDLKPENILIDERGHVKLVDFGFAKRVKNRETYTLCGTPEYLAPEVIRSQGHTTAVDWWALGILMYEFITGYPPFWHANPMEIYKQICNKPITFAPPPGVNNGAEPMSENAKSLITQLCTIDRTRRLGNLSGGAKDVKAHPWFDGVDWDRVYNREYDGPIIPKLGGMDDASCFERYEKEEGEGLGGGGKKGSEDDAKEWDKLFEGF